MIQKDKPLITMPMQLAYTFKNMSESEKQGFYAYFEKKVLKIEKMAGVLYDKPFLDIHVEKFVKNNAYEVNFMFRGSPEIIVSEDDHTINEAIDLAEEKLFERIRKLKEKMRG